jgi:hypothetical protein
MVLDAANGLRHTSEPADYSPEISMKIVPPLAVNEGTPLFGAEHDVVVQAVER